MTERAEQTQELCGRASAAAAYLDGEMDASSSSDFELHARACRQCSDAVAEQRRLLCLLDAAFSPRRLRAEAALPKDFARKVTARAQTDMTGLRRPSECLVALKLCVGLGALAALLLGASLSEAAFAPVADGARAAAGVAGVGLHALTNAGAGAAVVMRALGGRLVAAPGPETIFAWAALLCATALLLRLIGGYHRRRAHPND